MFTHSHGFSKHPQKTTHAQVGEYGILGARLAQQIFTYLRIVDGEKMNDARVICIKKDSWQERPME